MTSQPILVTGGTGRLGRAIVHALAGRADDIRVLTRRPAEAAIAVAGVRAVCGDFARRDTLRPALAGIDQLVVLSPIGPDMAADQIAVMEAAVRAGVRRILKISGSDWSMGDDATLSGAGHLAVEHALAETGMPWIALRPTLWAQTALAALAPVLRTGVLDWPYADAAAAMVDVGDIAAVAADLLLSADWPSEPLVLTGPEAIGADDLARRAGAVLRRDIVVRDLSPEEADARLAAAGASAYVRDNAAQFRAKMRAGAAAGITPTVADRLRRPARPIDMALRAVLTG